MQTDTLIAATRERADLLETLSAHRGFLHRTVRDLTDEQAARRPTASALSLGGIIKHVADMEEGWANFVVEGPSAIGAADQRQWHRNQFDRTGDSGDLFGAQPHGRWFSGHGFSGLRARQSERHRHPLRMDWLKRAEACPLSGTCGRFATT